MKTLLAELKNTHGAVALKAEFEAEGMTFDEAFVLKNLAGNLNFTIKIGGCEAVKDLREAEAIGANSVVAPMIESPYAFKKFMSAAKSHFCGDLYINIETISGFNCLDEILESPYAQGLAGIIFGRTDFCGSLGLGCKDADSAQILEHAKAVSEKARAYGKKFIIGGCVSPKSLEFFSQLPHLSGFETRKVIFNAANASAEGILKAIEFEMLWLKQTRPNSARLELLERRAGQPGQASQFTQFAGVSG